MDVKPAVGMKFYSLVEGEEFYKRYAHSIGFSVRNSTVVRDKKTGIIIWKYLLCSKEGYNQPTNQSNEGGKSRILKETREGCGAKIKIKRMEEGIYEIKEFVEHHTHALATPTKRHLLRSARKVNSMHKAVLFTCSRANIGPAQAYQLIKHQVGGYDKVGCTQRDLENYQSGLKVMINDYDAQMFKENFERKKELDPSSYFAYDIDDELRLRRIFWADGIGRKNYGIFGDIISFDTTYGTNKYSMIFAPFTGRNHRRQCITFGAAFLADEKVESFVWLFEKFLEAMGGHKPKCIITDQDPAMKVAINKIFDTSSHRFCMWHILRKVSEKVGGCLNSNIDFHDKLGSCVWQSETPEEFEHSWTSLVNEFGLTKNDWFSSMYEIRQSWIPAYFKDLFLAGLFRTTSISESENSVFGSLTDKWLNLVEFWVRYESIIERQRHNQTKADHETIHSHPILKTNHNLERHARDIYTHENFYVFQKEFWSSCMDCGVKETREENGCLIYVVKGKYKQRTVTYNTSNNVAQCSCKLFEQDGIPCRHILCVFKGREIDALPPYFMVHRWTKSAMCVPMFDIDTITDEGYTQSELASAEISELWKDFHECAKVIGYDINKIRFLRDGIMDLKKAMLESSNAPVEDKSKDLEAYVECTLPKQIDILPPKHSKTKGSGKRIPSGKEQAIEQQKRQRLCKTCGKYAQHDSRNCPTKVVSL